MRATGTSPGLKLDSPGRPTRELDRPAVKFNQMSDKTFQMSDNAQKVFAYSEIIWTSAHYITQLVKLIN